MDMILSSISEQNLTIFLWSTRFPHTIKDSMQDSFYPQYLLYDYGIKNLQELHSKLLSLRYYAPSTLDDILSSFTIKQLKILLKENGLKVTGNKEMLISRIKECIPQNVLSNFQSSSHLYSLSDLGNAYVNEHYDYVLLHKHPNWNISIDELNDAKSRIDWNSVSFRDATWKIFNERVLLHSQVGDFNSLHIDIENLSEICFSFDNSPRNGIYFLLAAFYLDANCLEYYPSYKLYTDGLVTKDRLYFLQDGLFFNDFWIEKIRKYGDYIDTDVITKAYGFIEYPIKLYTLQDFIDMISEITKDISFNIQKWQDFSQNKFILFLDSLV